MGEGCAVEVVGVEGDEVLGSGVFVGRLECEGEGVCSGFESLVGTTWTDPTGWLMGPPATAKALRDSARVRARPPIAQSKVLMPGLMDKPYVPDGKGAVKSPIRERKP